MKPSVRKSMDNLKYNDLVVLNYLYLYRAMDVEQIMEVIYKIDTSTPGGKRSRTMNLKRLIGEGVVNKTDYTVGRSALQITNKGIEIVRFTRDIPNQIYDGDAKTIKKGYYTEGDLKLTERFINHQVHLNQFMLDFTALAKDKGYPWKYYDEKFLSQYVGMRPDGLITMLDCDFFIEIDMASESKKQLIEKWNHYITFMQTGEFQYKTRKIIVLFDIDNIVSKTKIKNRIQLVKATIAETILDKITGDFEIVVDTRENLIKYMFDSVAASIMQKNEKRKSILNYLIQDNYTLSFGYALNKTLQGDFYNYYCRQLDKNNKIVIDGGFINEFFLDFYVDKEMSVLHRIDWYQKNSGLYKHRFHRGFRLYIVVDSIEDVVDDFNIIGADIPNEPSIFFIDLSRFDKHKPLYENLYQLGFKGEIFKIDAPDLSRRKFVSKMHNDEIKHRKGRLNKQNRRKH